MMPEALTLRQTEAVPADYPDAPAGLSTAAAALADVAWARVESYIAHRYSPRTVEWFIEGPGHWSPPLAPVEIDSVEAWASDQLEVTTPEPSPFGGFIFPGSGPYKVVATVGTEDDPPAPVLEAVKRLAEYIAAKPGKPGARSESIQAGSIRLSHSRHEAWMARAIQNSGAADLLRPYRRA